MSRVALASRGFGRAVVLLASSGLGRDKILLAIPGSWAQMQSSTGTSELGHGSASSRMLAAVSGAAASASNAGARLLSAQSKAEQGHL